MKNLKIYLFTVFIIAGVGMGCNNFLTPSVDQEKPTETVIQNKSDLQTVVNGVYDILNDDELYGQNHTISPEVMSDNAFSNGQSGRMINQDNFNFTINDYYPSSTWNGFYDAIATANLALQADLESSPDVDHIKGQAYALRALSHMNLLLVFGQQYVNGSDSSLGIPYITSYNEGKLYPSRDSILDVWTNIGKDLNTAISMLDKSRFNVTQINYWAALGLQTRYYLYTEQYEKLIETAEEIIDSGNFNITPTNSYISVWESGGGPESLFELVMTETDQQGIAISNIAKMYHDTEYGDVEVTENLYEAYNMNDIRRDLYSAIDGTQRMQKKYFHESGIDNIRVIRYAEVILNYAEALARNPATQPQALAQLNKITSNRNAPAYSAGTVENVLQERRLELAMEGHRLFDLARTERDIPVGDSDSYRGSVIPYGDYRLALPIPNVEIQANSNIGQNKGYK